jgi:hypothetical protein
MVVTEYLQPRRSCKFQIVQRKYIFILKVLGNFEFARVIWVRWDIAQCIHLKRGPSSVQHVENSWHGKMAETFKLHLLGEWGCQLCRRLGRNSALSVTSSALAGSKAGLAGKRKMMAFYLSCQQRKKSTGIHRRSAEARPRILKKNSCKINSWY